MKSIDDTPYVDLASNPPKINIMSPIINSQLREEAKEERAREHWHASDLGYCIGGVYYDRLYPRTEKIIDDSSLMNFAIGNLLHDFLRQKTEKAKILIGSEDELYVYDKKLDASGKPDLLIQLGSQNFLYDNKTVHEGAFYWNTKRGYKANKPHIQQIHFYYEHLLPVHGEMTMVINYISKNFSGGLKFQEIPVPYDPEVIKENNKFFKTLNKAWKTKVAPKPEPDVIFNEEKQVYEINWKSKYCNYHHLCTGNKDWLAEAEEEVKMRNRAIF